MSVQVDCPNCGAAVSFRYDTTFVRVCDSCRNLIARSDRGPESLGVAADLHITESPLHLWLEGAYEGAAFTLTGRVQMLHPAGGVWDEWYASFDDGRLGWLAEAQGRFHMSFAKPEQTPAGRPAPGSAVVLGGVTYQVVEAAEARYGCAEGEIPYRLQTGGKFRFTDLSGPAGAFATIDYSGDEPVVYVGRDVTLAQLGWADREAAARAAAKPRAERVACPECGGSLELRAPDQTKRVGCPYCGALLDATQGKLALLEQLGKPGTLEIELGKTAVIDGAEMTVIGAIDREAKVDGTWYPFREYLLYRPEVGFRWLVRSDGHWSWVKPVPAGEVIKHGLYENSWSWNKLRFKHFQSSPLRVDRVYGEIYWAVKQGEGSDAEDHVHPPYMLSREEQKTSGGAEVNWSLGTWVSPRQVDHWFPGASGTHDPVGVAPNQPFPHARLYRWWGAALALALAIITFSCVTSAHRKVHQQDLPLTIDTGTRKVVPTAVYTEPVDIEARQNLELTAIAFPSNGWVYVTADLIDEASGRVHTLEATVEHWSGVDGGESWSEGDTQVEAIHGAIPAGRYVLRFEAQGEAQQLPGSVEVRLTQDVFRWSYAFWALGLLTIVPLLIAAYHWHFERRRWENSNISPTSALFESGDDDE